MNNTAFKNKESGSGDFSQTPPDLWEEIRIRRFDSRVFDPCPGAILLKGTFTRELEGLSGSWPFDEVFVNPPYSNIEPWLERTMARDFRKCLFLLPVRSDQPWWHRFFFSASVTYIRGRVWFVDPKTGKQMKQPNFASCLWEFSDKPKVDTLWWPECHRLRSTTNRGKKNA